LIGDQISTDSYEGLATPTTPSNFRVCNFLSHMMLMDSVRAAQPLASNFFESMWLRWKARYPYIDDRNNYFLFSCTVFIYTTLFICRKTHTVIQTKTHHSAARKKLARLKWLFIRSGWLCAMWKLRWVMRTRLEWLVTTILLPFCQLIQHFTTSFNRNHNLCLVWCFVAIYCLTLGIEYFIAFIIYTVCTVNWILHLERHHGWM